MVSLKDLWQQQREQRQQEIVRRQQEVSQHQQQVREHLSQLHQQRLTDTQQLQLSLNEFQRNLQQQTQAYLDTLSSQRHQQAQALFANLEAFAQQLHAETQQFLQATSADRYLRADALFRELNQFHHRLSSSVVQIRGQLQVEIQQLRETVQTICAETQMYLSSRQQERLQEQLELANELSAYVQQLQMNVGSYLDHLNQLDQERAETLSREFQEQRQRRTDTMDALFQDLGVFRGELRDYCLDLRAMVWGGDSPSQRKEAVKPTSIPVVPAAKVPSYRPSTIQSPPRPVRQPMPSSMPAVTPASVAPRPPVSQRSLSAPLATPTAPEAPLAEPEASASTVPSSGNGNGNHSAAVTWENASIPASSLTEENVSDVEGEIFNYLQAVEGARLIEIEHALDINRFQTVDALRSLIKQGRVIQRDRIYVVQSK